MSAEAPDPVILDYIRANRGSFSRSEIVRELRLAGHEEADIEAAWALIAAEDPIPPPALEIAEPQLPVTEQLATVEPGPFVESGPVVAPVPFVARDPAIDRYIREHSSIYTRPAVTQSLLEAGHSREDIEAAWMTIAAEARPVLVPEMGPQRRRAINSWEFWVMALVTLPAYWLMISVATWIAVLQFFTKNRRWTKTAHGVSRIKPQATPVSPPEPKAVPAPAAPQVKPPQAPPAKVQSSPAQPAKALLPQAQALPAK